MSSIDVSLMIIGQQWSSMAQNNNILDFGYRCNTCKWDQFIVGWVPNMRFVDNKKNIEPAKILESYHLLLLLSCFILTAFYRWITQGLLSWDSYRKCFVFVTEVRQGKARQHISLQRNSMFLVQTLLCFQAFTFHFSFLLLHSAVPKWHREQEKNYLLTFLWWP